jgi:hypothetical protein
MDRIETQQCGRCEAGRADCSRIATRVTQIPGLSGRAERRVRAVFAAYRSTQISLHQKWYGFKAAFGFDPAEPTSLLYKKTAGGGYELIGAMYTAPKRMTEDQLHERVPLSVAQWHAHVNICLPPRRDAGKADWTRFGLKGSIAREDECKTAGGRWYPQIYGWMLHVFPYEETSEKIWIH